jgi:hypothetical protein
MSNRIKIEEFFFCIVSHSLGVLHKWDEGSSKSMKLDNLLYLYHSISEDTTRHFFVSFMNF